MPNDQLSFNPFPSLLGSQPDCRVGRRALHVQIDFSLGLSYRLDLSQIQSQGALDSVQTLYIDNSSNTVALQITFGLTNQVIKVPAGAQAYLPVLQGNPPVMNFTNSVSAVVDVQLMNFFVPPGMWYLSGQPVTDANIAAIIANGGLNVNIKPENVSGPTDRSGTITTGGTAQQLMPANAARRRWILHNPSTATEVLTFSYGAAAAGQISLAAGERWIEADVAVSGDIIYVKAATTGHAFVAYEW